MRIHEYVRNATHINIDNVVFHWECFLGECLQNTVYMTITLKINITFDHNEILFEHIDDVKCFDDFNLNLKNTIWKHENS